MKKVLSVLLAAAMVAGMSVSSFAADWTWYGPTANTIYGADNIEIGFDALVDGNDDSKNSSADDDYNYLEDVDSLNPGDDIYFPLFVEDMTVVLTKKGAEYAGTGYKAGDALPAAWDVAAELVGTEEGTVSDDKYQVVKGLDTFTNPYTGKIDKDWTLKTKTDKYIASVSFVAYNPETEKFTSDKAYMGNDYAKFVKVALVDDLDSASEVEVDFELFIKDKDKSESNTIAFDGALMANEGIEYIYATDAESFVDASTRTVFSVKAKANDVTFDFDDDIYFTVNLVKGEKLVLNLSQTYDKDIDKAYNEYDADLAFYNFKGSNDSFTKTGELFIPAAEETFIYEIVDGVITEIEAKYVTDYDIYGMDIEDGWVIETKELGYYVVADEELVVAEVEVEAEPEVEAEKANPETGAADFVGAAVAMAVVSVAAAGALALKK